MDENKMMEIEKRYFELFPMNLPVEDIASRLNQHEDDPDIAEFRNIFVNDYIDMMIKNNYAYDSEFFKSETGKVILDQFFKTHESYFSAFAYYLAGNNKLCLKIFKCFLENSDISEIFRWEWFAGNIVPFRGAFPEFWIALKEFLKSINAEKKYLKLVDAIELVYNGDNLDAMINELAECLMLDMDNLLVQELLGMAYYYNGDWRNAISYLENLENGLYVLMLDDFYFMLAWSYGKIKDHKNEVFWYEKCIKLNAEKPYVLNNLGYAYYKNKEFEKSEKILKKCVTKKIDLKYTAPNYVNTLLALGKIDEAKTFVSNPPVKLPKFITDKVSNYKPKKEADTASEAHSEHQTEIKIQKNTFKPFQFSNEKILEDELTSRLEKGENVFGIPLHIYDHKGDRYGRQYIIPVGRLDLLAEDDDGNLYIIELKKDSGYGDVYTQIRSYIDWFEKNKKKKSCKINGIICLNSPDEKLIEKVKQDNQVRLFEYSITYTEYK